MPTSAETGKKNNARYLELLEAHPEGLSNLDAAALLGVGRKCVSNIRSRLGISTPRPAMIPLTEEEKEEMQDLLADGESYMAVARQMGRSHNTISRYFPGYGWDKDRVRAENTARAALNKPLY